MDGQAGKRPLRYRWIWAVTILLWLGALGCGTKSNPPQTTGPQLGLGDEELSLNSPEFEEALSEAESMLETGVESQANDAPKPNDASGDWALRDGRVDPGKPLPSIELGAIPASFAINNQGQATYSIPIKVPPGRRGLEPSVGLKYVSNTHDGHLGVGWSLTGFSKMARCQHIGGIEGRPREVSFDSMDKFCLDGRRLVAVSGTYGQNGTEYLLEGEPMLRIYSRGKGPEYFEVEMGDGRVRTYGCSERIVDRGDPHTCNALVMARHNIPAAWAIKEERDRQGNFMAFHYIKDPKLFTWEDWDFDHLPDYIGAAETIEFAPERIEYTGKLDPATLNVTAYPTRRVTFNYAFAGIDKDAFTHGRRTRLARFLGAVGTETDQDGLVGQYLLEYNFSETSGRRLLERITQCDASMACLPPTRFEWSTPVETLANGWDNPSQEEERGLWSPILLDYDGDGRLDMVYATLDGEGFAHHYRVDGTQHPEEYFDYATEMTMGLGYIPPPETGPDDGDGVPVGCEDCEDELIFNPSVGGEGSALGNMYQANVLMPIDWDDDGDDDILVFDWVGQFWVKGAGFPPYPEDENATWGIEPPEYYRSGCGYSDIPSQMAAARKRVRVLDFNGDGRRDVLVCRPASVGVNATWHIYMHVGQGVGTADNTGVLCGTACDLGLDSPCHNTNEQTFVMDYDGDTSDDLVHYCEATSDHYQVLSLQLGGLVNQDIAIPYPDTGDSGHSMSIARSTRVLDLNGDGLDDLIRPADLRQGATTIRAWVNTGESFIGGPIGYPAATHENERDSAGKNAWAFSQMVVVDWDHDGADDLLLPYNYHKSCPSPIAHWKMLKATRAPVDDQHYYFPAALFTTTYDFGDLHGCDDDGEITGTRTLTADLDGNGTPDFVIFGGNAFHAKMFVEQPAVDRIVEIRDGMAGVEPGDELWDETRSVAIYYGQGDDRPRYASQVPDFATEPAHLVPQPPPACQYPGSCRTHRGLVVHSFETDNGGHNPPNSTEMFYYDARIDRSGRGDLGFGAIKTTYQSGHESITWLDNFTFDPLFSRYPVLGAAYRTEDRAEIIVDPESGLAIHSLQVGATSYEIKDAHGGRVSFAAPQTSRTDHYEYDSNSLPDTQSCTYHAFSVFETDEYGQTTLIDTEYSDGVRDVRRISLRNDPGQWLLGMEEMTIDASFTANSSQTRQVEFKMSQRPYFENLVEGVTVQPGVPDQQLEVVSSRDDYGNIVEQTATDTNQNSRTERVSYDTQGIYPVMLTNAKQHVTMLGTFDGLGQVGHVIDPNGQSTWVYYDTLGRHVGVDSFNGSSYRIELGDENIDGRSYLVKKHLTGGGSRTYEHLDGLGRVVQIDSFTHDGKKTIQQKFFDRWGRLAWATLPAFDGTNPAGMTRYYYDGFDRMIGLKRPDGHGLEIHRAGLVTTTYDVEDYSGAHSLRHGRSQTRDKMGRVVQAVDAMDGRSRYGYGPFGALERIEGPLGATTSITHDELGRAIRWDDPDTGLASRSYTSFGDVYEAINANGEQTLFAYDELSRPIGRSDKDGVALWFYDGSANGVGMPWYSVGPDGHGKIHVYDSQSRPYGQLEVINNKAYPLSVDYDIHGRVVRITYPNGPANTPFIVRYEYGTHGHMVATDNNASTLYYYEALDQDESGRMTQYALGGGSVLRDFDPLTGQLSQTKVYKLQNDFAVEQYNYDWLGRLEQRTDLVTGAYEEMSHDELGRIIWSQTTDGAGTSHPAVTTRYSANGNIEFRSDVGTYYYKYSSHPHAVSHILPAGEKYAYDAIGNQVERPDHQIIYTAANLLKEVKNKHTSQGVRYGYNAEQKRVFKDAPAEQVSYVSDLYEFVRLSQGPETHRYYVFANGERVAMVSRYQTSPNAAVEEEIVYPTTGKLGSTMATIDGKTGSVEPGWFTPFGTSSVEWTGQTQPVYQAVPSGYRYGFTGHEHDEDIGLDLVNMKGREYDPRLGRFLSADPVLPDPFDSQSLNPYSYVRNRVFGLVDPTGFTGEDEDEIWWTDPDRTLAGNDPISNEFDSACAPVAPKKPKKKPSVRRKTRRTTRRTKPAAPAPTQMTVPEPDPAPENGPVESHPPEKQEQVSDGECPSNMSCQGNSDSPGVGSESNSNSNDNNTADWGSAFWEKAAQASIDSGHIEKVSNEDGGYNLQLTMKGRVARADRKRRAAMNLIPRKVRKAAFSFIGLFYKPAKFIGPIDDLLHSINDSAAGKQKPKKFKIKKPKTVVDEANFVLGGPEIE